MHHRARSSTLFRPARAHDGPSGRGGVLTVPRPAPVRGLAREARAVVALVATVFALAPGVEPARAQPAPASTRGLSIEDAIILAERGSERVTAARAGVRRADAERVQARSGRLPQVSASASYDRTLRSEFEGLFPSGPGNGMGGMGGMDGMEGFDELPFGRANTWRLGLVVSQELWTGGRLTALDELATAGVRVAELGLAAARAVAVLTAVEFYLNAALADELLAVARATHEQAQRTLEDVRLRQQVGSVSEFDLLRAQVAAANEEALVLQQEVEREVAHLRLRALLELPADAPLVLTSPLDATTAPAIAGRARRAAGVAAGPVTRAAVAQATEAVAARAAGVRLARAGHLPSLRASSTYGRVAYPSDLFPGASEFRTNWTVGVVLDLPIFAGGRVVGEVRAAEARLDEAQADLDEAREIAVLDERTAQARLRAARAAVRASADAVSQGERAYAIAELRHRQGVSTLLELADARLLRARARANRARAVRDSIVAETRVALLAALPLGLAAGVPAAGFAAAGATAAGTAPTTPSQAAPTAPPAGGARPGAPGGPR